MAYYADYSALLLRRYGLRLLISVPDGLISYRSTVPPLPKCRGISGTPVFLLPAFYVPSIPPSPAAADTIYRYLQGTECEIGDFDAVFTGDLGKIGSKLLVQLLAEKGVDVGDRHNDCGVLMFEEAPDIHAGGSGAGCCATVLAAHILRQMRQGRLKNVLFAATGALLSPTTVQQRESIPAIAHLVNLRIS